MIDTIDPTADAKARFDVRHITQDQLQQLGMSQLAYVKPVMLNGTAMFAIHGADGSPMAVAEDRNLALAAIVQHEMIRPWSTDVADADAVSFSIHAPTGPALPLVLDSPHSGNSWPADWHPMAPREALETGWDAFVAELFAGALGHGATLIESHVPRTFIDLNRGRLDIDPAMLDGIWPTKLVPTDKSRRGFGLLRRIALPDVPVYDAPLPVAQVQGWLERYYRITRHWPLNLTPCKTGSALCGTSTATP